MKKVFLVLLTIGCCALSVICQESGNQGVYGRRTQRPNPSSGTIYGTEGKDLVPVQLVEAYVLFNAAPDEFVAVFGIAQEAPTAVESNQKVNSQIEQFLAAATRLGVNRRDTYVDMITQNRIYNFGSAGNDNTIREKLSGFETKKTVSIRYKDRALLEKLLRAAAEASIFDLIKVDYVVADLSKIRSRLLEEASTVIKQKEETYTRLLGLRFKRNAIIQESYETYYPAELYQTYTAAETGSVDPNYQSGARVVRERKSSTSFLEPLDRSAFDVVINSGGLEPVVQCTLYLKVRYSLTP
ncbi:MAG TPA: SIMPL domain-containing protein [Pyrinomonadaceae bacterium]|nr:SIMPL domain-containing protein [Pyrinomonadaceae bacterium]